MFVDLLLFGARYNPLASTKVYTKPPKVVRFLGLDPDRFRTVRWRVNELWRPAPAAAEQGRRADPFTPGWEHDLVKYKDCTDSLMPNTKPLTSR